MGNTPFANVIYMSGGPIVPAIIVVKQLNQKPKESHIHFDNPGSGLILLASSPFTIKMPGDPYANYLYVWHDGKQILTYDKCTRLYWN